MEDLLKKYEAGVVAYKNKRYVEGDETLQEVCQEFTYRLDPAKKMVIGMAHAALGRKLSENLNTLEVYDLKNIPFPERLEIHNLKKAAEIFYSIGAERHAGYVLPRCGSLMAEEKPTAGLRTLYDGVYRLENGGAPLKALAIKESLNVISKRILTQLRFNLEGVVDDKWARLQAMYALGEGLLLEGQREEALPLLSAVYCAYKEKVEAYDVSKTSSALLESTEMQLNYVRWTLANAAEDKTAVEECIEYANSYGDWLAWYPGPYTQFPMAPHCELDLRKFPPFEFMGNLHVPFSSKFHAAEYAQAGTGILGLYDKGILEDALEKARTFLEAAVEIYKEHEEFHDAACTTVCLIEALIRQSPEDLNLTDHVNFVLSQLDSEKDASMLKYLNAMVVPSALV